MKSNNKTKTTNRRFQPILVMSLLIGLVLALGVFAYKNDLFNIRNSDAQSKGYSKTYPAGDIVEKKPIKVLNYDDAEQENNNEDEDDMSIPQVNWRSVGHKIKVSTDSKGH